MYITLLRHTINIDLFPRISQLNYAFFALDKSTYLRTYILNNNLCEMTVRTTKLGTRLSTGQTVTGSLQIYGFSFPAAHN